MSVHTTPNQPDHQRKHGPHLATLGENVHTGSDHAYAQQAVEWIGKSPEKNCNVIFSLVEYWRLLYSLHYICTWGDLSSYSYSVNKSLTLVIYLSPQCVTGLHRSVLLLDKNLGPVQTMPGVYLRSLWNLYVWRGVFLGLLTEKAIHFSITETADRSLKSAFVYNTYRASGHAGLYCGCMSN